MLALTDFDGTRHDDHIVNAAPLAARATTHAGFIGLDDFFGFTTDPILIRPHHACAQLVKNLEGRFVARQSELPLKLNSRWAWMIRLIFVKKEGASSSNRFAPRNMSLPTCLPA